MIVVENLVKTFGGFHAVDGATLSIQEGSITGLIGPNGAGKTTTLRMLSTIFKPTSGSISICGIDAIANPQEARRKIGFLNEPLY